MDQPTRDPSWEGSTRSSASCQFPSWEGLGVGSWSQCIRKNEWRLSGIRVDFSRSDENSCHWTSWSLLQGISSQPLVHCERGYSDRPQREQTPWADKMRI